MIKREIQLFAAVRDAAGSEIVTVSLPPGSSAQTTLDAVATAVPDAAELIAVCRLAVNCQYVAAGSCVPDDAELAVIPPVSGG